MKSFALLAAFAALPFVACSSSVKDAIDGTLQERIDTIQDCFPPLFDDVGSVFEIVNSWRMRTSTSIPDPTGLTWSEQGDGSVDVTFVDSGTTVTMSIVFYSPTGVAQDLDLTGATTLAQAIAAAATQLAQLFGATDPFMVGAWTIAGTGLSGSGALTGIIGGTANQNELESVSTTTATTAGGPPPVADSTITRTDVNGQMCQLTFRTENLQTDTQVDQAYPIGTVQMTIDGKQVVTATITMDNTVIARIDVNDVPGHFEYDLETGNVDYKP